MEKIEDVSVIPCVDSKFVQPFRIKYKQARPYSCDVAFILFIATSLKT